MSNLENNKLIAEFMGQWNVHDTNGYWECSNCGEQWSAMMGENELPQIHSECLPDLILHAKYHTSWDWLMPVVEKIEEIAMEEVKGVYKVHRFRVIFNFTQAEITDMSTGMTVGYGDTGMKLESTYEAVVEFINWYNKNKKA